MHRTRKYLALALGFIILSGVVVFVRRNSQIPKAGFDVPEAGNTCACEMDSPGVVVLHVRTGGGFAINSESVRDDQLANRLRLIYGIRVKRVLYLFPDRDIPSQRITEVINFVKHLSSEETRGIAASREIRRSPEGLNIQIRLVTPRALSAPCPNGCYNWGTQGFPVNRMSSDERAGRPVQPLTPD